MLILYTIGYPTSLPWQVRLDINLRDVRFIDIQLRSGVHEGLPAHGCGIAFWRPQRFHEGDSEAPG